MASSLKLFVALLVAFGTLSESVIVKFKDCGSELGKLSSLDFDCDEGTATPDCTFTPGKEYHGKISFTPSTVINNGTILLHAMIGKATVPFPFPDANICKAHGLTCPLKADTALVADIVLKVPSFAPSIKLVAKMEIQTSNKEDVLCALFLARLA